MDGAEGGLPPRQGLPAAPGGSRGRPGGGPRAAARGPPPPVVPGSHPGQPRVGALNLVGLHVGFVLGSGSK